MVVRFSTKSGMPLARWTGPRNVLALQMVIGTFCATVLYREGWCWRTCLPGSATRIYSSRRYHCAAWCMVWAAYFLQYLVSSQKSSSIADSFFFPAVRYTCIFTIVSFFRDLYFHCPSSICAHKHVNIIPAPSQFTMSHNELCLCNSLG